MHSGARRGHLQLHAYEPQLLDRPGRAAAIAWIHFAAFSPKRVARVVLMMIAILGFAMARGGLPRGGACRSPRFLPRPSRAPAGSCERSTCRARARADA